MRPTRRSQPYRKGLATKLAGPASDAMKRGAPAGMANPMDAKRSLAKGMKGIHIPNPLTAIDNVWTKAQGPTNWPRNPTPKEGPPIQIAGSRPARRKRPGGKKPYER